MTTDTTVSDLIINKLTYSQWKTAKDGGTLSDTETYDLTDKDTAFVHTTGNETIAGTKTFSSSPVAPTPDASDNSTKVATTAWVKSNAGANRNIGEIIQSTIPLTDAGLHLLDGDLISGSGSYSAFVQYIANLISTYPSLFTTEADWQVTVNTYGICGKFVYDSTNNTVRLPKITGFTEGTITPSVLGNLTEAGLPNITGTLDIRGDASRSASSSSVVDGAFEKHEQSTNVFEDSNVGGGVYFDFDASRSNSIYGNSDTVQPQSIKVLYYIVIATTTKTDIEVDIDEVMTDLNMKMDAQELANVHCVIETYSNGASWYRLYDDGWVEQGGITFNTGISTIILLKPFLNTNYTVLLTQYRNTDADTSRNNQVIGSTTTSNTISVYLNTSANGLYWYACGYSA